MMRRSVATAAFALVLAGGTGALAAPAANGEEVSVTPMAGCGENMEASLNGAYARWTLSCSGGQITVSGFVEDKAPDNDCVGVRGEFASGETERVESCDGWGSRRDFTWTHPGSIADVYLYEF